MTVQQSYPTLAGWAPSWADIRLTYGIYEGKLSDLIDFHSLDWGVKIDIGEQRGASGGIVLRRSVGSRKLDEVKMGCYFSGLTQLKRHLMEKAPSRRDTKLVGLVGFDLRVQFSLVDDAEIFDYGIEGCRLVGEQYKIAEGADPGKIDASLNPIEVVQYIDGVRTSL